MADSLETLLTRLSEATAARHKFMIGAQAVQVDVGGDKVTYHNTPDSLKLLNGYIAELQSQINQLDSTQGKRRRAIGVTFGG